MISDLLALGRRAALAAILLLPAGCQDPARVAGDAPAPSAGPATITVAGVEVPVLGIPIYVMEFHVWAHAPFGPEGRPGWVKNGLIRNEVDRESLGPDWMRNRYQVGEPLVGYYDSGNPEVMRWQLRCLKAAGVAGTFIHLWADPRHPETFHHLPVFERMLAIAEEEGVQIAIHDEVQYRTPESKDALGRRAGAMIARFGRSKGYLRIAGKPAYAFQWWRNFAMGQGDTVPWPYPAQTVADLQRVLREGDAAAGEAVHWIPFHRADDQALLAAPEVGSLVVARTFNNQVRPVAGSDPGWAGHAATGEVLTAYSGAPLAPAFSAGQAAELSAAKRTSPRATLGWWVYAGFNDSTGHSTVDRRCTTGFRWIPRRGGRTLAEGLAAARDAGAEFIKVTSWNDWEENTAMEPGAWYEDDAGDPYLYCRILAAAAGRDFVAPPLPPKEAVDPLLWQRLYGIDRTPPHITRLRHLPMDPALVAEVVDSGSAVAGLGLRTCGDAWAGSDGTRLVGEGMTIDPAARCRDGGIEVQAGQTLVVAIDPARIAGESELWLGIEYADSTVGSVRVDYPTPTTMVDHRPEDERTTQLCVRFPLDRSGAWRSDVALLRAVVPGARPELRLRLAGVNGSVKTAEGALLLRGLHLFRSTAPGRMQAGREIAGTAAGSQVKSFRMPTPVLQTQPVPTTVWLVAEDAAGNRSSPLPVSGGRFAGDRANRP